MKARIVARLRRSARVAALRPWLIAPLAAAAVLAGVFVLPPTRQTAPLVGHLVDKHIAYAQIEQPAEFASTDRREVEEWFRQRATLRVTVPDYSPSGIRLVGGRIAEAHERQAAYVLYVKGHTLLSVFMVPASGRESDLGGTRVSYLGHDYFTREWKGYRTVAWTENETVFGLVSMLDYQALFQCADRLRAERETRTRL